MKDVIIKTFNTTKVIAQKYSPEILTGAGILGFIGTTVLAFAAGKKVEEVIAEHQSRLDRIDYEEPDQELLKRHVMTAYTKSGVEFTKLFAPVVVGAVVSTASILGGFGIVKGRYVASAAAYQAAVIALKKYRERVGSKVGDAV